MALLITWPEAKSLWYPPSLKPTNSCHLSFYIPPASHSSNLQKKTHFLCYKLTLDLSSHFTLSGCNPSSFVWAVLPDRLNSVAPTIHESSSFNFLQIVQGDLSAHPELAQQLHLHSNVFYVLCEACNSMKHENEFQALDGTGTVGRQLEIIIEWIYVNLYTTVFLQQQA